MIRIGIIGAGPNATGHGSYFAGSDRARVVAIADPDQERAQTLAKACSAKAVVNYQDFLGEVDAVVVASPNFLHREQAINVAKAGKHLYCEKPVGLSAEDARAVAAAVASARVRSQVGFSVRFDPAIMEMLKATRTGELGDLVSTTSRRLCWMEPATAGWRADHGKSGGLLLEINIHEIEWMMCAGQVTSVYARVRSAQQAGPRANDHIWVTLNYANGACGSHEGSWLSPTAMYYRSLQGSHSGMTTNEWGNELYRATKAVNRTPVALGKGYDLRGNFLDAIAGTAESVADVDWGVQVMTVCDAILASARSGQPVSVAATTPRVLF